MDKDRKRRGSGAHLFVWVEDKLRPIFDDAPATGSFNAGDVVKNAGTLPRCPVCGMSMGDHTIDHSTANTILNCPVEHNGAWDRDAFEPVNEYGMIIHTQQEKRIR